MSSDGLSQVEHGDVASTTTVTAEVSETVVKAMILLFRVLRSCLQVDPAVPGQDENWTHLQFTWSGKPFTLDIAESDRFVWLILMPSLLPLLTFHRVYDLKASLMSLTDVPPERQKILGLVKGKLPADDERMYVP